jgi:competence protein ComEC
LRQFPVGEFWGGQPLSDLAAELQPILAEKTIPFRQIPAGWSEMEHWKRGKIRLFANVEGVAKENNRSVVLHWQDAEDGLLLTGDLETEGVDALLASGFSGPASLLKLPHHGSRHSQPEKLVEVLQPELCLASAGFRNRYRLPSQKVVDYLQKKGLPLYRTDLQGTVQVTLSHGEWVVSHWENWLSH